jgi:hypothetical protein
VLVGPWTVMSEIWQEGNGELLDQKAIISMESFMEGRIEYYTRVPASCRPLVFTTFVKCNRPRAWKGIDTKIQDTLPLLGNDEEARNELDGQRGHGKPVENNLLAKVTLCLARVKDHC